MTRQTGLSGVLGSGIIRVMARPNLSYLKNVILFLFGLPLGLLTGLTAVVIGPALLRLLGVTDWRARGLAAGTAGHGLATARVLLLNQTAGAFGGLAIGLNGVVTALVVPLLARWLVR